MRKHFCSLLLFLSLIFSSFAQITYDKGYFIDNTGQRTECYIKNTDWKSNPIDFEYQIQTGGTRETQDIKTIKEFGVYNHSSFIKATVLIDRSSSNVNNISSKKAPEFKEETLFLKVLVTGDASLYSYTDKNLYRYFFKTKDSDIKQLVYKKYNPTYSEGRQINTSRKIAENNHFRQQLWNRLKCDDITLYKIENTDYNKKDLVKFFNQYNTCVNPNYITEKKKEKRDYLNISIKGGVYQAGFSMDFGINPYEKNTEFESQTNFKIGLGIEYILPLNRNKWALAFDPAFQYYESEQELVFQETSIGPKTTNVYIDYRSIELPVGIRYYSFLNSDSKLFFNVFYVYDAPLNSSVRTDREDIQNSKIRMSDNFLFGLGYQFKNKYSAEINFTTPRDLSHDVENFNYQSASIVFGYTIF
ncbi:porin family protein [Mangrovimonas aestuarii]|uniref:outer membrane beta-barrel protein n=1 Tax=Mangrovimonas aestuarii TaxID=3018443 RepID=UPI0023793C8B|nr:outer membrane beta-barrel protein [Mangrovimonas aestuarii]